MDSKKPEVTVSTENGPNATGDSPTVPAEGGGKVRGINEDQRSEGEISPNPVPSKEKSAEARKASTRDGESGKGARRGSMFEEAKDANALLVATGGKINETLQAFFTHKSNSADYISKKPLRRPKKIYENTYRLESSKPYCSSIVEKNMKAIMEQMLDQMKYNPETAIATAAAVAEKIRARVLAFEYDRYKILVHVTIGPMARQGVHQGFRCTWDSIRDSYSRAIFRNHNIFASAVVYAIYYE